jgi:DNA polymerase-3 subunit delta
MKLGGRDAANYLRKPDPAHAGILLFGADPMRVALKRQDAIAALIGPSGEEEMRLTRLQASEVRKDPALIDDAMRAQGFFPGHRVAFVEDASDSHAPLIAAALAAWQQGDAQIFVTAGSLTAKSALRKVFEGHPKAVAIGLYDDPPGRDEVSGLLKAAGLAQPGRDAMEAIFALSQSQSPGDFRQTLEKLSLYMMDSDDPMTPADIADCVPQAADVALDDILDVVTRGESEMLGTVLRNLYAQGVQPVTLCIGTMRQFRQLHSVASDPGGVSAGIGRLRPPVFGPRRDRMARDAGQWGRDRLERALTALTDVDLQMRSASNAPQKALMERTLIRLAMMARH